MANNRNLGNEPFFWIKAEQKAESPKSADSAMQRSPEHRLSKPSNIQSNQNLHTLATESARAGLQAGWIRGTFIIREEYLSKLKDKAYWDRRAIKDVLDDILGAGLAENITPRPSDKIKRTKK